MLPLSEARASADAGLVLAGDPIPVPTPKAPVISESRGPRAASTAPLKQTKPPAAAAPEVAKVLPNPKTVKPKAVPASTNTAFAVQVGIFAQAANVASVKEQLQSMGLAVLTEVIKMGGETRTRVRVGPFESEVQALQTAKKITDVGLPAVLVRLPAPAGSAGASASGRVP